ncbi:non-structural maintenance of chromosomes element 1 homolog isoform X1 [Onthophagus taurus]|uniref:non-structural maintenance of chromosomes element 1 homolog isoform X1 n=1 Tax=Onthophagus taurus TaxID=166361 RepID=UPI000C201D03|nr:non-structural maintenance of chromosomes element 1 homolog [Onthophagus taurus]
MEATRYGLDHQRFLSYVIKEGCLQTSRALEICKNFDIDSIKNEKGLKCFIQTINERIGTYSMHISVINCEITGISYVVLNDMANDDISRMQKGFKPIELKYFEMIVKKIFCSKSKQLLINQCLNYSSTLPVKISITDAEVLLEKWKNLGYFVLNDDMVYLGVRCLSEFAPFFWKYCENYVKRCELCSELVVKGRSCASCKVTIHGYCLNNFSRQEKCPHCNNDWQDIEQSNEDTSSEEE